MTAQEKDQKTDSVAMILAVICWVLPLAGFLWGPGTWWQYLIWLAIGTAVLFGYVASQNEN